MSQHHTESQVESVAGLQAKSRQDHRQGEDEGLGQREPRGPRCSANGAAGGGTEPGYLAHAALSEPSSSPPERSKELLPGQPGLALPEARIDERGGLVVELGVVQLIDLVDEPWAGSSSARPPAPPASSPT